MAQSCLDQAKQIAGTRLTEDEVKDAFSREQRIRQHVLDRGYANVDARVARIIVERTVRAKIRAAVAHRNAALNVIARKAADEDMRALEAQGIEPAVALRAMIEGIQSGVKSGRKSVAAQVAAFERRFIGEAVFTRIAKERPAIRKLMRSKDFNDAVMKEMYEIRPGGNPGKTGNQDALWMANTMAAAMEVARKDMNRFGANVGKIDGYMGVQTHDDLKMMKLGEDAWVKFTFPLIDLERTFPDFTPEEAREALKGIFRTIITDVDHHNPALTGSRTGPSNLGGKLSMERKLHFKDDTTAITYNDEFGRGLAINNMFSSLRYSAKITAAMERFGPNPKVMVQSMLARKQLQLKDAQEGQSIERVNQLKKQSEKLEAARFDGVIDMMTGMASSPVSSRSSSINNDVRAYIAMAKLGGAMLTAMPSDTITAGAAAMFRGRGFWNGIIDHLGGITGNFGDEKAKGFAYLLGEGYDALMGHLSSAALAHDGAPGSAARLSQVFFMLNGLSKWTDASRAVSARVIAAQLGRESLSNWSKIDPAFKHVLELNGITEGKWDAMRKTSFVDPDNGKRYMSPDRIRDLDDETVTTLAQSQIDEATVEADLGSKKGAELKKAQERLANKINKIKERAKFDLEMDLSRYISDEVNYSIVEVDAKSRRYATLGTRPGTAAGEAVRYIMQFKGFPVAFTERILGRAVKGQRGATAAERTLRSASHIGTMVAGMTAAGYMSLMMKDAAKGLWPPRSPTDPNTYVDSLLSGGGLGIYGDYLLGRASTFGNTTLETTAGPAAASLSQLHQIAVSARDGNPKAGKMLDWTISNTPFANLFYTRPVLDFLILNSLREWSSPGYLARRHKGRKKKYGQEYMLPDRLAQ